VQHALNTLFLHAVATVVGETPHCTLACPWQSHCAGAGGGGGGGGGGWHFFWQLVLWVFLHAVATLVGPFPQTEIATAVQSHGFGAGGLPPLVTAPPPLTTGAGATAFAFERRIIIEINKNIAMNFILNPFKSSF
jgi:hypothetical protein